MDDLTSYAEGVGCEIVKERLADQLTSVVLPRFWSSVSVDKSPEENLLSLHKALEDLSTLVDPDENIAALAASGCHRVLLPRSIPVEMLLRTLRAAISISIPVSAFPVMVTILTASVSAFEADQQLRKDAEEEAVADASSGLFWSTFRSLVERLHLLQVVDTFFGHPAVVVVSSKVEEFVKDKCADEFETAMLEPARDGLLSVLMGWIKCLFGDDEESVREWHPRLLYHIYAAFGKLRISELFDIIVEYPDSQQALDELKECLQHCDLREHLVQALKSSIQKRLLHHGANTADIITQYISSVKCLRILDPSGVILERVCGPVTAYLRTREDTVRCILASLTDETGNDLAQELAVGEPAMLDDSDEDEDQDWETWEPDPIDADPTKSAKGRKASDIISTLVNVYGSQEMFVSEYRHLLADRLLQTLSYDITNEFRYLELLKLRFGEANLLFCEVMIKDVFESRRLNNAIVSELEKKYPNWSSVEINSLILSHVFWPSFREESFKIPEEIQRRLDAYCEEFKAVKGMRTLEWKHNLGMVELELELAGKTLSFSVNPPRATAIYHFQEKKTWTVAELGLTMSTQPAAVRRLLSYWVTQGILKEGPTDTFSIVENIQETAAGRQGVEGMEEEEISGMVSAEEEKASGLQVMWSFIRNMLTNLGSLPIDRIHQMLNMFAMQGPGAKELSLVELKTFLDKKVKEQALVLSGGSYQLSS